MGMGLGGIGKLGRLGRPAPSKGGGSIPAGALFFDTFSDANGTSLDAHTPEQGGAWVEAAGNWKIASGGAALVTNNTDSYAVFDAGVADGTLQATVAAKGTIAGGSPLRLAFRFTDISNFWIVTSQDAGAGAPGNFISLWRNDAGSYTNYASAVHAWADGDVIKVVLKGDVIEVVVNGVAKLAVQSPRGNTATKHGISVNNVDKRWDNVSFITDTTLTDFVLPAYLLPTFKEPAAKIMRMMFSDDGASWSQPIALDRGAQEVGDFSIIRKDGLWRIIGSNTRTYLSNTPTICYFTSANLIEWAIGSISMADTPSAYHIAAPTWFDRGDGTLSIVYNNVVAGPVSVFWEKHQTAAGDYSNWSAPAAVVITSAPTIAYDAYVVKVGSTYSLFFSDGNKSVELATASDLLGPYTIVGADNWAGWGANFEGVSVVNVSGNTWWAFIEPVLNPPNGQTYKRSISTNVVAGAFLTATWGAAATITARFSPVRGGEIWKV